MTSFDDREQAAYERVAALFAAVDPHLLVGDGTWTARDVLAHLCNVARRYTAAPRLADSPREVDSINAEELSALDGLPVTDLLGKFERAFERYREVWVGMGSEHMWPFHAGGQLPTAALRANWLGEMVIHGYDAASAAGLDWPISAPDAVDLLMLFRAVAPSYTRAGELVAVEMAGDGSERWTLAVRPEGAQVDGPGQNVDATLTGSSAALILLLYQRLDLGDAERDGLAVAGDRAAVVRLIGQLEKP